VLDGRQVEEFLLTASQALLGVAALLTLRFPRWLACTLLGLFAVQYAVPGQSGRYLLAAVYGAIALVALIRNRRNILPALAAPFRALRSSSPGPGPTLEPTVTFGPEIERIDEGNELSDLSADASAAAAGYSRPRTRS
jgi:hypothetical protein